MKKNSTQSNSSKYHVEFDIDFKRNPYKGTYIAIEGIDGSGKTAQAERLAKHFLKLGKKTVKVREPRKEEGVVGDLIQKILLGKIKISPVALQFLFTADRILNQDETVIPALKSGECVVSDRSFWSTIPYALSDIGEDFSRDSANQLLVAHALLSMYHRTIVPDVIFYLNVSVDTAMKRISGKSEEREIYEKREKIEKHFMGYNWLLKQFPKEFTVIDGEQKIDDVAADVIKHLNIK